MKFQQSFSPSPRFGERNVTNLFFSPSPRFGERGSGGEGMSAQIAHGSSALRRPLTPHPPLPRSGGEGELNAGLAQPRFENKSVPGLPLLLTLFALLAAGQQPAAAQSSSLLRPPSAAPPPVANVGPPAGFLPPPAGPGSPLQGVSWTYSPPAPLREFRIHDPVTIRVDELARVLAEGQAEKRRLSLIEAILTDWIRLSRFRIVPDLQEDGSPTVGAESRNNARAKASVEARESMTMTIAAQIVDIRPNGNLVLEARKSIRHNDNLWETSLSGMCRPGDVAPDNVVLSRDMIDLEIHKQDRGQLRDGYSRGWFTRLLDRAKPF